LKHAAIDTHCKWHLSPPMRGRGLKLGMSAVGDDPGGVAPHAGAWIETPGRQRHGGLYRSPPMRGRGLKPSP